MTSADIWRDLVRFMLTVVESPCLPRERVLILSESYDAVPTLFMHKTSDQLAMMAIEFVDAQLSFKLPAWWQAKAK